MTTAGTKATPTSYSGALLRFRIMAFTTGTVLILGCVLLILKAVHVKHMEPTTGLVWLAHGYLYLIYVIITFLLGLKLRWPFPKFVLVIAAGTIPTMSFVAEHFVTRQVRANEAANQAETRARS